MRGETGHRAERTPAELAVIAAGVRAEMWSSLVGAAAVAAVTVFYAWRFSGLVAPHLLWPWVTVMALVPVGMIAMLIIHFTRRPDDAECVRIWRPVGRGLRLVLNLAVIVSPWIFLPVADGPLRALLLMLYVWFLATEVFANLDSQGMTWVALAGVPLSVGLYLLDARVEHALPLTLFLLIAGATLFGIDRQMRANRIRAERAQRASVREAEALRQRLATVGDIDFPTAEPLVIGTAHGRAPLTPRQVEVAKLLSQGLSNKEIAQTLDVSPATVKAHVAQVIAATGARNRTGASARAQAMGLF
jgi:DNA-binding CsgD family transcriptional regulator